MISLYSVSTARYSDQTGALIDTTLGPYTGTVALMTNPVGSLGPELPVQSDPLVIKQWVDERTYTRPSKGAAPEWGPFNPLLPGCLDWLEMKTLDYCAGGTTQNPNSEAMDVLSWPTTATTDWSIPPQFAGEVSQSASTTITWRPESAFMRFPHTGTIPIYYWGLTANCEAGRAFEFLAAHEARHCWQYNLVGTSHENGIVVDDDADSLPDNPPSSSPELYDGPFAGSLPAGQIGNPECDFQGDTIPDIGANKSGALERNAVRFQARAEGLSLAGC